MRNFSDTLKDKAYLLTLLVILAAGAHLALGAQATDSSGWHTGQAPAIRAESPAEASSTISADVIETRMFRLVDDSGAERATMTVGSDGPVLKMYTKDRSASIELRAKDDGSLLIEMQGRHDIGGLRLTVDADTMPALKLEQRDQGSAELEISDGTSGLRLNDHLYMCTASLLIDESDSSRLALDSSNASEVMLTAGRESSQISATFEPITHTDDYAASSYSVCVQPAVCGYSMMNYTKEASSFINTLCTGRIAQLQCSANEGDQKERFECELHSWAGLQSKLITTDGEGKHEWPEPNSE